MRALFLYGTLRHPPLLAQVLGRPAPALEPARLPDHRVTWAEGQSYPLIERVEGAVAEGALARDLSAEDRARLDFYEGGFGYDLVDVTAETVAGPVPAQVYLPEPGRWVPGAAWSLSEWERDWGALSVRAADEVMDYYGRLSPEEVARRFPLIRMRAASWLRGRETSTPVRLRSGLGAGDVECLGRRRPYAEFFLLEEQDLRFRAFDGDRSPVVNRAAFVAADAVTVLPYDPVRDRVLLVEQFRFAPYVRGDRHPWTLEPIAGRIDPGEAPEATAHRETREETGLTLRGLERIARYYTTAGAVTEYVYSYAGIADLPDGTDGGIGGEAAEAEDIRSVVVGFERLMEAVRDGEAETGPLIISALWLERNRARLRGAS